MLEPLTGLPAGVIGFAGRGEMHSDDYTEVLLPAVDALWEDLKMGTHHLSRWERIALVTDVEWMTHLTHLFGWMTPGELKVFPVAERAAAVAWAAAEGED